ncbi:MAG TPA: hypothetical protein VKU85_07155, partial [bacterium]|nr:hypothetical protein [bacterium]
TLLVTGILATAAVYGPWHAYVDRAFPQEAAWERQYNLEHLGSAVEGHDGPWWYHLGRIPRYFGELAPLSLLWFLSRLPRGERRIERAFVAAWWFVPYAFFSAVATRMPGYAMVAAPAIFVMIGCHWVALRDRLRGAPGPGRWLAGAACVLLLALPARYGVERVKPLDSPPWDRAEARAMERLGDRLAGPPTVVFRAERPIELMFHADLIAYPQFPSLEEVALAVDRGYRVVVLDHGDAPAWLREDPRVTLLEP